MVIYKASLGGGINKLDALKSNLLFSKEGGKFKSNLNAVS